MKTHASSIYITDFAKGYLGDCVTVTFSKTTNAIIWLRIKKYFTHCTVN